jgi:uncharacterized membrane protein
MSPPPSNRRYALAVIASEDGQVSATGLNAHGDVVGSIYRGSGSKPSFSPFTWSAATGALTLLPPSDVDAYAAAVNDAGDVAINEMFGPKAFRWSRGHLVQLASGWLEARASGIDRDGTIVGAIGPPGSVLDAFATDAGGAPRALAGLGSGADEALAIAGGVIVGTSGARAVSWIAGRAVPLPVPGRSIAAAVSSTSLVAGACNVVDHGGYQGFVLDLSTGKATLVDPPAGAVGVELHGVNAAGLAVGSVVAASGDDDHAIVWSGGVLSRLDEAVDPEGWHLVTATAVNDSGQIVARGIDPQGNPQTVLLTPR